MGEAWILKRGAAAGQSAQGSHAMICVSAPAGGSLVCARADESLRLDGLDGVAAVPVNANGNWNVTVSDGVRGRSAPVPITGGGELACVTLTYPGTPAVSESGKLFTAAGGLKSGMTLNGTAVVVGGILREGSTGGFWLGPAVNLTGYSTLTVTGVLCVSVERRSRICVGSTSEKVKNPALEPEAAAEWMGGVGVEYTASLDISSLSGAYYIGSASMGNNLELTRIVLS